jgi:HlyD family secretion protein
LKAQIDLIDEKIKRSSIVNPIDGVVLSKYVEENEMTAPGKPIYSIQAIDKLIFRAYLQEDQLTSFKIGDIVTIEVDGENENLMKEGRVTFISSQAEFTPKIIQTKNERKNLVYAVKVEVKNDGSLKFGMPGSLYIKGGNN